MLDPLRSNFSFSKFKMMSNALMHYLIIVFERTICSFKRVGIIPRFAYAQHKMISITYSMI